MFAALKNMSSKVALGGAEDAIDQAKSYIEKNPHESFMVGEMSRQLFEQALSAQGILQIVDNDELLSKVLGIPMEDDFWSKSDPEEIIGRALLSPQLHTSEFHKTARHFQKQSNQNYKKNTAEWAAANLAMAACSILGASPDIPKRERTWNYLVEVWKQEK